VSTTVYLAIHIGMSTALKRQSRFLCLNLGSISRVESQSFLSDRTLNIQDKIPYKRSLTFVGADVPPGIYGGPPPPGPLSVPPPGPTPSGAYLLLPKYKSHQMSDTHITEVLQDEIIAAYASSSGSISPYHNFLLPIFQDVQA
jgi:hypothetical protein